MCVPHRYHPRVGRIEVDGNIGPSQMITTERSVQNSAYGGLGSPVRWKRATARRKSGGAAPRVSGAAPAILGVPARRLALLVPALVALWLYVPTREFGFVWDDVDLIVGNAALHAGDWGRLWTSDYWSPTGGGTGMWRPWVMASFGLDQALGGGSPVIYHLGNVALHVAVSTFVTLLALEIGLGTLAAVVAGAWFASAPAASEAVAWISGRTDLWCALGVLVALWCERRARSGGRRWGIVGMAAAAIALLSKETAFVLPVLLLAAAAPERGVSRGSRWKSIAPYGGLVLIWAVAHRALADATTGAGGADPGLRASAAAMGFAHFGFVWPWAPHAALLSWSPVPGWLAAIAWVGFAGVIVLGGLAWRQAHRLTLPLALAIVPLVPVCAAVFLEPQARFAERSLYLPLAGIALLLAALVSRLRGSTWIRAGVPALCVLAQAAAAMPVIEAWRSDATRIARIAATRPSDLDATLGLVDVLGAAGRFAEADAALARAERTSTASAEVTVARAVLAMRRHDPAAALQAAEAALQQDPGVPGGALIRLRALGELGRRDEALSAARELAAQQPRDTRVLAALGHALLWAGELQQARAALDRAAQSHPEDANLAYDQGVAAARLGLQADAESALQRAVGADPALYDAWLILAHLRAERGDVSGMELALTRAEALPGAADGRAAQLRATLRR